MNDSQTTAFAGFDIGGTRTDVIALIPGISEPLVLESVGANLKEFGPERVAAHTTSVIHKIQFDTGFDGPFRICLGVAGAGRKRDQDRLARALSESLAPTLVDPIVVSDADVALEGAFSGGSGMIVIAGTGSGVHAKDPSGKVFRAGGWGPALGDPGSGRRIGERGLRSAARAMDGGQHTTLVAALQERFSIVGREGLVEAVYDRGFSPSKFAPVVLDAAQLDDEIAVRIVHAETRALANEALFVSRECESLVPRVAFIGGLCGHPYFRDALEMALIAVVPALRLAPPDASPSEGALRIAKTVR